MKILTYYEIRNWLLCNKYNENIFYFMWILFLELTVLFFVRSLKYIKDGKIGLIKIYLIAVWHAFINKTPMELYPYKKT